MLDYKGLKGVYERLIVSDAQVDRQVDALLEQHMRTIPVTERASDIHLEPRETELQIRMRCGVSIQLLQPRFRTSVQDHNEFPQTLVERLCCETIQALPDVCLRFICRDDD